MNLCIWKKNDMKEYVWNQSEPWKKNFIWSFQPIKLAPTVY